MSIIQKAVQSHGVRRVEPKVAEAATPASVGSETGTSEAPLGRSEQSLAAFAPLQANGFLQIEPGDPASRAELRHLKRSVLQCAFGPVAELGANVLMITSAMPGAGKTFLSANLSQALALERDRTALLIDADDTRATISRALGLQGSRGFFDVLHEKGSSLDQVIHPTDIPGLNFVPAGARYDDALELLTSNRARELIAQLVAANPNRLIVVDCPPLLGTPNAAAIAALAGQVLVVVESGETSQQVINQALELLNRDKPIGLVLNKVPRAPLLSLSSGSYYYYYAAPEGE